MRIMVRTSKWAIWARRFGSFALPLALIPVLMHRAHAITSDTFVVVEIVAATAAILALAISISAFVRIWITGDHGWGKAVAGLILGLICLAPAGFWGAEYLHYPMADQVSTDPANPPPLVSVVKSVPSSPALDAKVAAAFPNVKTRNYPLPPGQLFDLVNKLVIERGWDVLRRRQPGSDADEGQLNAVATTLFGFRDEVSIRILPTADGTDIAMRSAALSLLHEPGSNGSRIEDFLTTLDGRVTLLMKDQPAGDSGDDSDADSAGAAPAPRPTPHPPKR